ncbi:MAG: FeoA family protein [Mycoplasma sp.]
MKLIPITLNLSNKTVVVSHFTFDDENIAKRLNNIGIFKGQKIHIKTIGNNNKMVGITVNGVTNVLRTKDAMKIFVESVKHDEWK